MEGQEKNTKSTKKIIILMSIILAVFIIVGVSIFLLLKDNNKSENNINMNNNQDDMGKQISDEELAKISFEPIKDQDDNTIGYWGCIEEYTCVFKTLSGKVNKKIYNEHFILYSFDEKLDNYNNYIYFNSFLENDLVSTDIYDISKDKMYYSNLLYGGYIYEIHKVEINGKSLIELEMKWGRKHLLNQNFEKVIKDDKESFGYFYKELDNGNILVVFTGDERQFFIYDINGKKIYESKKYTHINAMSTEYINARIDNKFILMNLKEEVIASKTLELIDDSDNSIVDSIESERPIIYSNCWVLDNDEKHNSYFYNINTKEIEVEENSNYGSCI